MLENIKIKFTNWDLSGTRPTFSFAKEKVGKKKATLKITI